MKVGGWDISHENILKIIKSIPYVGAIFIIANFYANSGVLSDRKRIANFKNWVRRVLSGVLFTFVLSLLIVTFFRDGLYNPNSNTAGLDATLVALSIFPSILGFGIGVFVVVFALPNQFIEKINLIKHNGKNKTFGASLMVVDMACPLMVYAVVLMGEFFLKLFQFGFITHVLSIFLLLYGMLMTFDLISMIFMTAYALLATQASRNPK
ncbi:hypothetical protein [Klebsiella pneumoniae]|uniref:hypothetical protein n=1 Tax=Klebsiella pneumoniae TaxID=573 RepID=UPI001F044096|nr:hypothetical protein [Klebsiella pneumoniae]